MIIDIILALSAVHVAMTQVYVEEVLLGLGVFLDVSVVTAKEDAVEASV